jgi:hypothetical protein
MLTTLAKSEADAAEYQLYNLLNGDAGAGAHHRGEYGDEVQTEPVYGRGSSEAARLMWAHTEEGVDGLRV